VATTLREYDSLGRLAVLYDQYGEGSYLRTGTGVETRYQLEPTRRFLAGIDTDSTATGQHD
jgi:hypothetical protein